MLNALGKKLGEKQEQQLKYAVLILIIGAGLYFFIYLSEQQRQQFEMQIQTDINFLQNIQPAEYSSHLSKLRSYLN